MKKILNTYLKGLKEVLPIFSICAIVLSLLFISPAYAAIAIALLVLIVFPYSIGKGM